MDNQKFLQTNAFKITGGGISLSDTSITVQSFRFPDGSEILSSDLGSFTSATLEPGSSKMEIISFTGVTQNLDGTATLTGVTRGLKFKYPYDQDLSLRKSHAGNTTIILSNNPQMYDKFVSKLNDETIEGKYTFDKDHRPELSSDENATDNKQLVTKGELARTAFDGGVSADDINAGVSEIATVAEIDAGTANGGTGARLVMTPDRFASSKFGPLVTAQATPNMTVAVKAFSIAELSYAGGSTSTITAPATNPRIDLVVLTSAGALAVRTGAEAVSPAAPTPTDGDIVIARITLATTTTAITNTLITPYQIEKYVAPTTPTQLYRSWVAGQALSAGDALVLNSFVQPLGRILYDNNSSTFHSNVTNASYSFTVGTGSNRILFVMVNCTGSVSGVTYAGQSMTLVDSILQSGWTSYKYKLVNPPSGSNTVSITGTNLHGSACQSFSNVDQATNVEVVTKSVNGGGGVLPGTITPLSSCAVVFASFFAVGASGSIISETATFNSYAGNNKTNSGIAQGNITVTNTGYIGTPQLITTGGSINCSSGPTFVTTIQVALKPANPVASPRVIKASAAAPTDLNNLILTNLVGFARTSVAAEANVDVVYSGIANGLSGLTMNSHYFLSNTAGAIATSAGTNSKKVGLAVSSTELLIKNENA